MRRWLLWLLAIAVGVVVVILVTALVGNRDKSEETVPAGEWAQSICGAFGVWRGQMEAIVEDIRTPPAVGAKGTEEPQSETPQGRTGFVRAGLEQAVQATDTMVKAVDNAGTPDTPNGDEAAALVSSWADGAVDELQQAQDSLDEEADSLEDAIAQVTGAVKAIGSVLTSGVQTDLEIVRTDPELEAAFRDSSTCRELREETG